MFIKHVIFQDLDHFFWKFYGNPCLARMYLVSSLLFGLFLPLRPCMTTVLYSKVDDVGEIQRLSTASQDEGREKKKEKGVRNKLFEYEKPILVIYHSCKK